MKLNAAKKMVEDFFDSHGKNICPSLVQAGKGKVYELYCLARTVELLDNQYGVSVRLQGGRAGTTVDFKSSPGAIDRNRSHFVVYGLEPELELHTDIEVTTLSSSLQCSTGDLSAYHEIDLVLVNGAQTGRRPRNDQIVLGVECKAQANFRKDVVRQVLGVRRELSFYRRPLLPRGMPWFINADPPSEYWLAFVDPKGMLYQAGPSEFGIEFLHWCPR